MGEFKQTVGVSDTSNPSVQSLDDGCIMDSAGSSGDVTYSFDDLFSAQDDCSSVSFAFISCNTTASSGATCGISAGADGVTLSGAYEANTVYSVYVSVSDVCGNSAVGVAQINVHNEHGAAEAGAEDCKVV